MPGRRFLIALGGALFLVVLVRTAWLSELSYLTLRTIEHAATGHGLRWNVSERVQVFDHPAWMGILLAGRVITGESYYTTFAVSLALSAATAVLVLRSAPRTEGVVLGTLMLALSWAIVTFSTSGLEGPLAHLLVISFCLASLSERPAPLRITAGLAGLAALTHVSTLLITLPPLIAETSRVERRGRDRS
jgi:arabinofuranosyltransferase